MLKCRPSGRGADVPARQRML